MEKLSNYSVYNLSEYLNGRLTLLEYAKSKNTDHKWYKENYIVYCSNCNKKFSMGIRSCKENIMDEALK